MATYDRTGGGLGAPVVGSVKVKKKVVDLNIAGASGTQVPETTDVIQVFRIPKGSIIQAFGCKPVRIVTGTSTFALTGTFGSTSGKGATIAGTCALAASGTAAAVGTLFPATLTTPLVDAKATADADDDFYLTITCGTQTTLTDLGSHEFYVAYVDLTFNETFV